MMPGPKRQVLWVGVSLFLIVSKAYTAFGIPVRNLAALTASPVGAIKSKVCTLGRDVRRDNVNIMFAIVLKLFTKQRKILVDCSVHQV